MTLRTMAGALWYLQSRSWINALKARARRLRQPKYLIGAILGGIYLVSIFGRWIVGAFLLRRNAHPQAVAEAGSSIAAENLGATVLLGFMLTGWFFAKDRAAIAFTEAEVANLFPAPLSRQLLLWYRILRGQTAVLFSILLLLIFTGRILLGFQTLIYAVGWWILLSTLSLHGLGASFAIQRLTERGLAGGWRRLLTLAIPATVVGALWLWYQALPAPPNGWTLEGGSWAKWQRFAGEVFQSGPAPWLLWPFRLLVRPLFANGPMDAVLRFIPALALLGMHAVWVLRSAVSFEEASLEHSRRQAEIVAGLRAGQVRLRPRKRVAEPFELKPRGPRWVAWWWCGLIESRDTLKKWLILTVVAVVAVVAIQIFSPNPTAPMVAGTTAVILAGLMILLGGQSSSQRFARMLRQLDLVKGFPVRGWELFLGVVLGGLTGLILLQWLLLAVAAVLLPLGSESTSEERGLLRVSFAAAAFVAPMASLLLAIPVSIGFVVFPGWFTAGKPGAGVEATGQRMMVGLIQLTAMGLAALPVAVVTLPGFVLGQYLVGPRTGILVAAGLATLVLTAECALGVWWIGRRFEGLDAAEEQ